MKRILACAGLFALALNCFAAAPVLQPVKNDVKFTGKFYLVNQVTEVPAIWKTVTPVYPDRMRSQGIPGEVEIAFVVNEKGGTEEIQVATATDASFGEAARDAVKRWRFKSGKIDGKSVRVVILQKMTFNLDGTP